MKIGTETMSSKRKIATIVAAFTLVGAAAGVYAWSPWKADTGSGYEAFSADFGNSISKKSTGATSEIFDCTNKDLEGLIQLHTEPNFVSAFEDTLCLDAIGQIADLNTAGPDSAAGLFLDNKISGMTNDTGRSFCFFTEPNFQGAGIRIIDQGKVDFSFMDPEFKRFDNSISSIMAC